jgi:hypothetical protein
MFQSGYFGIRYFTGGVERMRISQSGNVGIGTSNPLAKLMVAGDLMVGATNKIGFNYSTSDSNFYNFIEWQGASSGALNISGGIWTSTASQEAIRFSTQQGVKMSILNSGAVGIGTTSPLTKLHIKSSEVAVGAYQQVLEGVGSGYGAGISFQSALGTSGAIKEMARITSDGEASWTSLSASTQVAGLRFYTTNTGTTSETMRINGSGNVGIGTTSPSQKLDVNGGINVSGNIITTGYIYMNNGQIIQAKDTLGSFQAVLYPRWTNDATYLDGGTGGLYLRTNNGAVNPMYMNTAGNVGIGTTSPRGKLDVTTTFVAVGTANDSIVFGSGTITYPTAPYGGYGGLVSKGSTSDARLMMQDGNGRINNYWNAYSDAGGYKYIVGSEPAAREQMSVSTNGFWSFYGAPSGTSGSAITFTQGAYIEPNLSVWFSPRGTSSDFYINNSGNVGIGTTSPVSKLSISGGSLATSGNGLHFASELTTGRTGTYDTSSVSSIHTFYDAKTVELTAGSSSGYVTGISATGAGATGFTGTLRFITSSAERMRIFANGNVAIGTTTDSSYKLDVTGTLRTTSNHINQGYLKVTNGIISGDNSRIFAPQGASYVTTASVVTGAFKIKLPVAKFNSGSMIRMTIKIYTYNSGVSFTFDVGGYNYTDGNWYNVFAQSSTESGGLLNVRFGRDATSNCIWIGELASTWSYPQVYVTDFQGGFVGYDEAWSNGWSITPVTAFDTVSQTRTSALELNSTNNAFAYNLNQNLRTTDSPTFSTVNASLIGGGSTYIQSTTVGTSYSAHYQIREKTGGGSVSTFTYAPALGFHWSGIVASSIAMEASGRIAIMDNPGTGYQSFIANNIYFQDYLYGSSKRVIDTYDSYLRLNQANSFTNGIYTPYNFRADGTSSLTTVTANGYQVNAVEGNGLYFWNDSVTYTIKMGVTAATYQYGPVTDYSMRFTFGGGTSRGFTWGYAGNSPSAALNAFTGNMQIAGVFTEASSIRYKEDIKDLTYSLDDILKLRGVTYKKKGTSHVEIGVIAEEVNDVIPEIVTKNQDGTVESVSYGRLSAIFIEAFKQQQEQIELLKKEINLLKQ